MLLLTPAVCSEVEPQPQHREHTSAERGHRRSSHSGLRLYCARHHHYMQPYSLDLTEIGESVTKGDPKRARLLNASAWTVQQLSVTANGSMSAALWLRARDPAGERHWIKGQRSHLQKTSRRGSGRHIPRVESFYSRECLLAFCGVRVSEATVCRAPKHLSNSRQKIQSTQINLPRLGPQPGVKASGVANRDSGLCRLKLQGSQPHTGTDRQQRLLPCHPGLGPEGALPLRKPVYYVNAA